MIPLRVRLKGFLCYKEEQEVTFDGSSLWMLSGLNGSGKSAIFDAVTYSLFGHHRGGSVQAHELVNKNSEGFEVEFDFLQDGQAYRIRRTLKKRARGGPSTTQQILKRVAHDGNGTSKWEAIEDTSKRTSFDQWVADNIGLTYETFTSSVLLLQGKAEKLLDSTAKGRFEVLAGIVDLERYQRLHEQADSQRKEQEGEVKSLKDRLAALPEISATEILEAETRVQSAEAGRQAAWQEVERLQALEYEAKQCQEVQQRLAAMQQKVRQAELLLTDAEEIERDEKRLKELQAVLPAVKNVLEQRRALEDSERKLAQLNEQERSIKAKLAHHEEELQKAQHKRRNLQSALEKDESRRQELSEYLREVTGQLAKLKEFERQEQDLARIREDLERLGENPVEKVKQLRTASEQLAELGQVVPRLTRFAELRRQLHEAVDQEKTASIGRQQIEAQGKKLKAQLEQLKSKLDHATRARQQADEELTQARTLHNEARKHLNEILEMAGAKVCRHCGQELTANHLQDEKVRREKALVQAEGRQLQAHKAQQDARRQEEKLQKEYQELDQQTQQARDEYVRQRERAEQARKDVQRLQGECKQMYEDLPPAFQHRISTELFADWLQTTYPESADLEEMTLKAAGLDSIRKQLRTAEGLMDKWTGLKGQENTLRQSLRRMQSELPQDTQGLREKHAELEAEEKTLLNSLAARRNLLLQAQKELDQLGQQRERIQQDLSSCQANLQAEKREHSNCHQALTRFLKELPETWKQAVGSAGLTQLNNWVYERDQLLEKQTEQRAQQLRQARATVAELKQECTGLEARLAAFPEEARQGPQAVQQLLKQARDIHRQRDEELGKARQNLAWLEHQHQQREQLQGELLIAEGKLKHCKLLADLLSRDRLQLHLVRQAERQVVDHANAVLDRLSGGELYLRLCGEAGGEGNSAKALELEAHNRVTGEKPINVAFLSGSQKFRVAVSLALGIGQYASRQHRPIESVIIDEGFGCLDRNARQVMIQELQNLRSQMRCILLVSHQEEFADAFSDGYHFELHNGSTVARRFQK